MHDCVLTRKRKFTYINNVGLVCTYVCAYMKTRVQILQGFILFDLSGIYPLNNKIIIEYIL